MDAGCFGAGFGAANRWVNIVLAVLYVLSILAALIGQGRIYYIFGSIVEIVLLLTIVWFAWSWPRRGADAAG